MSAINAVEEAKLLTWIISKNGLHAKPWLKNQEWLKMEKYDLERIVKKVLHLGWSRNIWSYTTFKTLSQACLSTWLKVKLRDIRLFIHTASHTGTHIYKGPSLFKKTSTTCARKAKTNNHVSTILPYFSLLQVSPERIYLLSETPLSSKHDNMSFHHNCWFIWHYEQFLYRGRKLSNRTVQDSMANYLAINALWRILTPECVHLFICNFFINYCNSFICNSTYS